MIVQRDHFFVILLNGAVGRTTRMITRGDRCCTCTDSSTGMGSVVGGCLLTVDFFLTFGLGNGVLTDPERK